jgi:paraquat-inducible protein B
VSRKANSALIGVFVVGALSLFVAAILIFSSQNLFTRSVKFYTFFDSSLNGLDVGAPVKFKGIRVGTVTGIEVIYDNESDEAMVAVIFDVNANLFKTIRGKTMRVGDYGAFYAEQIGRGLAVKLSMESILTGKLYVGLDYHNSGQRRFSKDVAIDGCRQIPSVATELDEFMASFDAIVKKVISLLDALTVKVKNFNFDSLNRAMDAISDVLAFDSSTRDALDSALQQLTKMVRSLRVLLEYLERNPNALVAGRHSRCHGGYGMETLPNHGSDGPSLEFFQRFK